VERRSNEEYNTMKTIRKSSITQGHEEDRGHDTKKILMIWRINAFFHIIPPLCSENSRSLKTDFLLTTWI